MEGHVVGAELWEILVPTKWRDGRPVRTRHHKVWDDKVRAISGGLTVLEPTKKGEWVNAGAVHQDRCIPVRIMCTPEQLDGILDMTLKHYEQLAVMAYRISSHVVIRHA